MFYSPSKSSCFLPDLESRYKDSNSWPSDLVSVSDSDYKQFFADLPPTGKVRSYSNNAFVWVDIITDTNQSVYDQITELESTVTPRRVREALLSSAGSEWLSSVDSQIEVLRAQLV